jgi:carbonic anhydrase
MNIHDIVEGSETFRKEKFKKYQHRFEKLVKEGQSPKILFIGCSDSRVLPNLITDTGPGDLFVIRNIGNFVAPYKPDEDFHSTAAAIEYAVSVLEVEDIIVCGHSHCGAIGALYTPHKLESPHLIHVKRWLTLGEDAKAFVTAHMPKDIAKEEILEATEKVSAVMQLDNLMTYPVVRERVEAGKLYLNAWHYNIENGSITYFESDAQEFVPLNS